MTATIDNLFAAALLQTARTIWDASDDEICWRGTGCRPICRRDRGNIHMRYVRAHNLLALSAVRLSVSLDLFGHLPMLSLRSVFVYSQNLVRI
jgi:hypothetical protein